MTGEKKTGWGLIFTLSMLLGVSCWGIVIWAFIHYYWRLHDYLPRVSVSFRFFAMIWLFLLCTIVAVFSILLKTWVVSRVRQGRDFRKVIICGICAVPLVWISCLSFVGFKNYQGYCERAGRPLSEQEKLERGIAASENEWRLQIHTYIPYKSVAAVLKENPDCCKMVIAPMYADGSEKTTFWDRLIAYYGGTAYLKYKIRYHKDDGAIYEALRETYVPMDNCGLIIEVQGVYK